MEFTTGCLPREYGSVPGDSHAGTNCPCGTVIVPDKLSPRYGYRTGQTVPSVRGMTPEEKGIMADMFYFLRDHNEPPVAGSNACTSFWEKAAKDIGELVGGKWKNHPLAVALGIALYGYIETKGTAKEGDGI